MGFYLPSLKQCFLLGAVLCFVACKDPPQRRFPSADLANAKVDVEVAINRKNTPSVGSKDFSLYVTAQQAKGDGGKEPASVQKQAKPGDVSVLLHLPPGSWTVGVKVESIDGTPLYASGIKTDDCPYPQLTVKGDEQGPLKVVVPVCDVPQANAVKSLGKDGKVTTPPKLATTTSSPKVTPPPKKPATPKPAEEEDDDGVVYE